MNTPQIQQFHGHVFAIDFDGTCVTFDYPSIGVSAGGEWVLAAIVQGGGKLVLWTMRSGDELAAAVQWFKDRNIPLYGINENPSQACWTSSPKVMAAVYIDDAALGAPLVEHPTQPGQMVVDWDQVAKVLGIVNPKAIGKLALPLTEIESCTWSAATTPEKPFQVHKFSFLDIVDTAHDKLRMLGHTDQPAFFVGGDYILLLATFQHFLANFKMPGSQTQWVQARAIRPARLIGTICGLEWYHDPGLEKDYGRLTVESGEHVSVKLTDVQSIAV